MTMFDDPDTIRTIAGACRALYGVQPRGHALDLRPAPAEAE
jgi:hypothetical protein